MFRWLAAAVVVLGCVLAAGCLLASVFLALQRQGKDFLKMLGMMMISIALVVASAYADYRFIQVYYGYFDQSAKYIGYIFPGLVSLFFFPEPLRRAKMRLKMQRSRYGGQPKAPEENRPSTRVSSLPTRRR